MEAPLDFVKEIGLTKIRYEFRETITQFLAEENNQNPFLKFGYEMARVMARPLVIQTIVAIPGKIKDSNGFVKGSTVQWVISINDLLNAKRNFEMYIITEETNWISIILICLFCTLLGGITGYKLYTNKQKNKEK